MSAHSAILTELAPGGIWVAERTLWFGGVRLRSRMTIVRVADGRLWVHSAGEPTPELCAELDRLGPVGWIVVPNRYHHLHAPAMKLRYPEARVIGPNSAKPRNDKLVLDLTLDDPQIASLIPGLSTVALQGVPFLDETLFFHTGTGTLIGADLMMCGCAADHWTWRWTSKVLGQFEHYKAPPDVRWNTKGGPEVRQAIAELGKLPLERILVAHSDPVVDRPVERLQEAWSFIQ